MTLPLPPLTTDARPLAAAPAIDRMSQPARAAILGLAWAAWYSSRSDDARTALAGAASSDPLAVARAAGVTAEATLKLLRLKRVAAGDAAVVALVDGLLAGGPVLAVPLRLRTVMLASDVERQRMLGRARAAVAALERDDAQVIAAVIAYLVGTQVDLVAAIVAEDALARGYTRAVLQALGLPFDGYMPRLRGWL
jgi:hypothetical protein